MGIKQLFLPPSFFLGCSPSHRRNPDSGGQAALAALLHGGGTGLGKRKGAPTSGTPHEVQENGHLEVRRTLFLE